MRGALELLAAIILGTMAAVFLFGLAVIAFVVMTVASALR